jgi:Rrf2 family protein
LTSGLSASWAELDGEPENRDFQMAAILKISDATAIALHTMVHLALVPDGRSTTTEISEIFKISRHHLAKVHQKLRRAGLITSARGAAGGVALAKDPAEISLLDIYELMEGEMDCDPCLFGKEACPRNGCMLENLLPTVARQVHDYFEQTTLKQIAEESNWKGVPV